MAEVKPLRIAWLGSTPLYTGGAPGVVTELLEGLTALGHQIDCFFPGSDRHLPQRFAGKENLTFIWGASEWRWNRWYSRTKIAAFVTGLLARASGSLRLRREIARRHRRAPYDVIYQNSTIESLAAPASVVRSVPLVIRPDTHIAGELRWLLAERRLAFACQPRHVFLTAALVMSLRTLVQRVRIRRASLLICISRVFRDHLVHDYGFPLANTVVVPNPVRLERFVASERPVGSPARVLVLGRISVRKGVEDVVAVARELSQRGADVRVRVVGGPSLWSDYTPLLAGLPPEDSEYVGRLGAGEIPAELAASDILLQASKYEPFGLTVAEALAAGVPVVATSEVGAVEGVDRSVVEVVAPGDVTAMASAVMSMLERLSANPAALRASARAEAERLFSTAVVCRQISDALERLVGEPRLDA
ncbi:MAG TPA: glycosyltransferase family 4 protein [Solirubrobacteraceae bacterium]|nr:glycosyltransferase family 4 protein [Solirubrobacteraceae bacterium]